MSEDRADASEADEDGGGGGESINKPPSTFLHIVSKSILKAQKEQTLIKPSSANAEDQSGGTLNEPTY